MLKTLAVAFATVVVTVAMPMLADLATSYFEQGYGLHPAIVVALAAVLGCVYGAGAVLLTTRRS